MFRSTGLAWIYEQYLSLPSDIQSHLPFLKRIAQDCSSVVEIGMRNMVSTHALLMGLSKSNSKKRSYLGIDLISPPLSILASARYLSKHSQIQFRFKKANDLEIDLKPVEFLFIDSLHTYCHLTYELEKFSPKISHYIALHDTSDPWGTKDDDSYSGDYSEYPSWIDRNKKGLWPAVQDFLVRHPEWFLQERNKLGHGLTILKKH